MGFSETGFKPPVPSRRFPQKNRGFTALALLQLRRGLRLRHAGGHDALLVRGAAAAWAACRTRLPVPTLSGKRAGRRAAC